MAKATRANDDSTPKKRSRKAKPENGNGTHVAQPVTTAPALANQAVTTQVAEYSPVLEERVRSRAYEIYLQRGGQGGSPEQDWMQALQEICGQHVV